MIRFNCKKCGQRYKADNDFAGEKIECKKCGSDVPVPSITEAEVNPKETIIVPKLSLPDTVTQMLHNKATAAKPVPKIKKSITCPHCGKDFEPQG